MALNLITYLETLQSKFVFIRKDSHKNPLQRPYDGPYRVISRGQKTFLVDLGGRPEVISLDRLKAVYIQTRTFQFLWHNQNAEEGLPKSSQKTIKFI